MFKNFTLKADNLEDGENRIIKFVEENNHEAYIDFYINKISNEDKENLITLVPDSDKKVLELHLNAKILAEFFMIFFFIHKNKKTAKNIQFLSGLHHSFIIMIPK